MSEGFENGFPDVSGIEDAGSIPDGGCFAVSDSPGYIALTAMIAAGDASLVADQYLPDGRRLIMVQVGMEISKNPRQMQVRESPRGFEMAHKAYSDWRIAWWREAIQNSVDAKAKNISLEAKEVDGYMVVSCDDDGIGMDMDTIENKFLVIGELGGEGKGTGAATGGFGIAKKILCFKWPKWEVYSRDNLVVGQNGSASGEENQAARRGTILKAWMPLQTGEFTRIDQAKEFLSRCHLSGINFTLNGEPWQGPWLYNGRRVMDEGGSDLVLEGDKVDALPYYTKESKRLQAQCYVRLANGMYMHTIDISSYELTGYVIIELIPKKDPATNLPYSSIEYLKESRDEISDSVRYDMNSFLRRIAQEREDAVKGKPRSAPLKFAGAGKFKAEIAQKQADALYNTKVKAKGDEAALTKESADAIAKMMEGAEGISSALLAALLGAKYTGQVHVETAVKQIIGSYWKRDFRFYPDATVDNFRIPKKFYPDYQPTTIHMLARVWAEFCTYVMVALNCDRPFCVGWVFSTKHAALYWREGGDDHLLINPYLMHPKPLQEMGRTFNKEDLGDNPLLDPFDESHLYFIFTSAVHEATHMVDDIGDHGPVFAAALTYNMALCAEGFKELLKIAKGARAKARAEREKPFPPAAPPREAAAVAAESIENMPVLYPVEDILRNLIAFESTGYWKGFTPLHSQRVKNTRMVYPLLDSPIQPREEVATLLSRGIPVFAEAEHSKGLAILIPTARRGVMPIDYSVGDEWSRKAIKLWGEECPLLLAASLLNGLSALDIFYNLSGPENGYYCHELPFQAARYTVEGLYIELANQYAKWLAKYSDLPFSADAAKFLYRLVRKFGNGRWSVQEGFKEVSLQEAMKDIANVSTEGALREELSRLALECTKKSIPELGWPSLYGADILIPDMRESAPIAKMMLNGEGVFYLDRISGDRPVMVYATAALSQYTFRHNQMVEALAKTGGQYQKMLLIAQGRMIDTLSYMLHLDRLESLMRGRDRDEFKARDSLNSWLSQVYAEIDLARQRASYFREHGLDMEEMVNSILKEIDGAAGWMSSQK